MGVPKMWDATQQHPPFNSEKLNTTTNVTDELFINKTAQQDKYIKALVSEHDFLYEEYLNWNNSGGFTAYGGFNLPPPPPLELPVDSQIVLICLYSLATILSVTGNALVIYVMLTGNRSKSVLAKYLINLAVSDLCMAFFCIPLSFTKAMLGHWIFGTVMCPIGLFIQVTSVAVGIFTNTAIGVDRQVLFIFLQHG